MTRHANTSSRIGSPLSLPLALTLAVLAAWIAFLPRLSLSQAPGAATIGYEREINRYRWTAHLDVDERAGAWQVQAVNRFASDAYVLFDNRLSFRDEDRFRWALTRPAKGKVAAGFRGSTAWFSQSRVLQQSIAGVLPITPSRWMLLEPALGVTLDQRPGAINSEGFSPLRRDAGPMFGGRIQLTPGEIDGYRIRLASEANLQLITPRRGRLLQVDGAVERLFDQTRFATRLTYSNVRRDAYQAVSFLNRDAITAAAPETVEATTSDTLAAGFDLSTPIARGLTLAGRFDLGANNRIVRTFHAPDDALFFDTDFHRRSIDVEAGLRYTSQPVQSSLTFSIGAETEARTLANRDALPPAQAAQKGALLEQADYDRNFYTLQLRTQASLTSRLTVLTEGTATILRHDTPVLNQDDRDEVFFNGQVGLQYQINPALIADIRLLSSYYHTVYLKAQRSAENSVQRSLRLRPNLTWTPTPSTRAQIGSEVRATYTVDDYVLEGRRPQDQSARELRYDGTLEQDIGSGMRVLAEGTLSDLRLGRFFQDRFAEIPFDTLRTYGGRLQLQAGRRVVARAGVRFFIRTDYDRATTVRYRRVDDAGALLLDEGGAAVRTTVTRPGRRWIEQIGPTGAIDYRMLGGGSLRFEGWLNLQRIRYRLYGDLPEESAAHIRAEARRGSRRYIPNLAVTVVWPL
ncbi:MAG: hypothetical protein SH809_00850 [Rhodothermales bacterium]|nr:hypothetical protein [Rhodothermales bacterium]